MKAVRPAAIKPYIPYAIAVLIAYCLADVITLFVRPTMLPKEPPPKRQREFRPQTMAKSAEEYSPISNNNIFHEGKMPPPLSAEGDGATLEIAAVRSNLPLKLVGTIVHANPKLSVSTIEVRNEGEAKPFRVDDEIGGMAKITKIERRKVIFINRQTKKREYIDIPFDEKVSITFKDTAVDGASIQDGPVIKKSDTEFAISRKDLDGQLKDLPSILRDARVTPNLVPGGGIEGFRFVWIKPGSIYEKLGLRPGDIVRGANNEEINDPNKAQEALSALRNSDNLIINIIRNGREEKINYSITQ